LQPAKTASIPEMQVFIMAQGAQGLMELTKIYE
jgi:hypothetical protein